MNAARKGGSGGAVPENMWALLERRTTLQEWLAKLDDLGSRFRPEVTDRVRADYTARLGEVAGDLEGHRGAIESSLDERRLIHEDLGRRFDSQSAELEEAELRFEIGEFGEAAWSSQRIELASTLEAIKAEQDEAAAAVQEMEAVLADLSGGEGARKFRSQKSVKEPVAEPVAEPVLVSVDELVTEPEREPVPVADSAAETEAVGSEASAAGEKLDEFMDELEFLESLSLDDTDSFDAVSRMLEDEETTGDGSSGRADR